MCFFLNFFFIGHQFAPSKHSDPRDPGLPGKRPGGKGPEETLQPGAEESAAGRVPQGESSRVCLHGGSQPYVTPEYKVLSVRSPWSQVACPLVESSSIEHWFFLVRLFHSIKAKLKLNRLLQRTHLLRVMQVLCSSLRNQKLSVLWLVFR